MCLAISDGDSELVERVEQEHEHDKLRKDDKRVEVRNGLLFQIHRNLQL